MLDLPPQSCDSHVHVFGDPSVYPAAPGATYAPLPRTITDLEAVHNDNGIARGVLVQPAVYGADNRAVIDALAGRPHYRGVAAINNSVGDDDLARMHAAGIRGIRFGLGTGPQEPAKVAALEQTIERVQKFGWHIKLGGFGSNIAVHEAWLRNLTVPAVLDHMAGLEPSADLDTPHAKLVFDLLDRPNWWIMIANADRRSREDAPWRDLLPLARALLRAAPVRALWASDWPHILHAGKTLPRYADLLQFLSDTASDRATMEAVLVHNPQRLYGFGA